MILPQPDFLMILIVGLSASAIGALLLIWSAVRKLQKMFEGDAL